ncbi:MAG: ketosteroid isomerase-like protein [Phenylobacterium sp.]|nr:ketosteroid isomerase-like protein [Phenylobacterium sp.]
MRALVLLGAVASLLLSSAAMARPAPAASVDKTIRGLEAHWNEMIAARDLEGIVGLYAADGMVMPANTPLAQGPAAVRKVWTGLLGLPGLKATLTPVQVDVAASGDLAVERGAYALTVNGATEHGKYLVVWKKVGPGWKVSHDMFSGDAPAP